MCAEPDLDILVRTISPRAARGIALVGRRALTCAVGRGGIRARKREGDGGSPRGAWRTLSVYYRCDRLSGVRSRLPVRHIRAFDGWCDARCDRNYNRRVRLPYPASTECLMRVDELYDLVVVLDYNVSRRLRGRGSAIFLHVARPGFTPTEGCLALSRRDLTWVVQRLTPRSRVRFGV